MSSVENKLPEGWVETTLGEVTDLVNDKILVSEINITNYISTENLLANKMGVVSASSIPSIPKVNNYKKGDTLFSNIRTYFKKVWFSDKDGGSSNDVLIFRPKKENKLDNKYLFYFISSDEFIDFTVKSAKGTKMPRGDKNAMSTLTLSIPKDIKEQKAIAKVLTAFDDKIENLQAQNKILEQTAQTIFKEWFGKYQIGDELPEGFTEVTLKDIIDTANTGLDAIKRAPIVEEYTGVKCFRIQDASQKKKFDDWGNSKVEDRNFKKFQLLKGDILIARTGNSIGVNYLVKENLNSVFNNGLIRLRTNSKSNYLFLNMIITSRIFERHIQSIAYGTSTQPNMQINSLLSFEFVLPSDKKQKKFKEFLIPIVEKQKINQDQINNLTKIRDTLLPKLMSGEIRVNEFKKQDN